MFKPKPKFARRLTLSLASSMAYLALSPSLHASERPLMVYGWPLAESDPDKMLLNQDAIMGTYVCPSLTRLNLQTSSSELVLLDKLQDNKTQWVLTPKASVKWWSGKALEGKDLLEFLKSELPSLVKKIGNDQWPLPNYTVEESGKDVKVVWESAPVFGPYILNRTPFYRRGASGLECAGTLKPEKSATGLAFTGSLNGKDRQLIFKPEPPELKNKDSDSFVSFRFGDEMHPQTFERQIEEELSCPSSLDLPIMTMIAWNPEGTYTKDEMFRKAMTYILPRGALLRAGAGSLGDLISAPILRAHPGYKKSLLVLPYDLRKADAILNQMGFMRSEKDGYRRTANGEILEIAIATDQKRDSSLLRKVLDDSFRALGMKLRMVDKDSKADGMLAGIAGSWPENDLAPLLHSKLSANVWPWAYRFTEIDDALNRYNLSLTQAKPDFAILENIHDLVYKREPFSVLVQHKSCMQYGKGVSAPKAISVKKPDWIRGVFER
jgi:hypothetical protein